MRFVAKYQGECAECGEAIKPGDDCLFVLSDHEDDNGKLIAHEKCPQPTLKVVREVCETCFQEKSVSGYCGC